ncbi:MAG: yhdN 1 [Firmicutes bacterium]|nr:yhdN 1 [Bacillota bacterium]
MIARDRKTVKFLNELRNKLNSACSFFCAKKDLYSCISKEKWKERIKQCGKEVVAMNYQILGKTGLKVSEVGFGGIPIMRLNFKEATRVTRHAFDRGITFFDTANMYKDSEVKLGKALLGIRDQVVIATKTGRRDAAGALEHLELSLQSLQTGYIDLYQFHQVAQEKEWNAIIAPGGAMETVMKAKEQGKVRHIGITSHSLPMAIKFVQSGLFETIQFPFNFIEEAAKEELFVEARRYNVGIIVMKPFAGGIIDRAALAFKYLRQQADILPIPGFDSTEKIDEILAIYQHPNVVSEEDLLLMDQCRSEVGNQFCRRCEYCQPCPNGVMITAAMGYGVIAKRMSPAVAVDFAKTAMETVPNCVDCGVCKPRCPYQLPIPEILRKHYALYQKHREAQ